MIGRVAANPYVIFGKDDARGRNGNIVSNRYTR